MAKMGFGASSETSQVIMAKMRREAKSDASGRRSATLDRLEIACRDIVDRRAFELAKQHQLDTLRFRPSRKRLVPEDIAAYVSMRARLDGVGTVWTGPKASTIRHDKDMLAYLVAINDEFFPKTKRTSSSSVMDDLIDSIGSVEHRLLVRRIIEESKNAKLQLNMARLLLRQVSGIDLTQVDNSMSVSELLNNANAALNGEQKAVLKGLLTRITDNRGLAETGLIFKAGKLRMDYAPSTEIITKQEIEVLCRLADHQIATG